MTFELVAFARHDPAHCIAPGLFRSFRRGTRATQTLDVVYETTKERLEFRAPTILGPDDLRFLQGLVAMAGHKRRPLRSTTQSEHGRALRKSLYLENDAVESDCLVVEASCGQLAKNIGYKDVDGGNVSRLIREAIERLSKVSIVMKTRNQQMGFRLLSTCPGDDEHAGLLVALNPRIYAAVYGERWTRIDMQEVRKLSTDAGRLVHQRLCGWINPGAAHPVSVEKILGYVWPGPDGGYEPATGSAESQRRRRLPKALHDLQKIGWKVSKTQTGKFVIHRPRSQAN
jgi:Replication protein C (RepC)